METTTSLINRIRIIEEENYKLETDIRNFSKRKRINEKKIQSLKDELIKKFDEEKTK